MLEIYRKLYQILEKRDRRIAVLVFAVMLLAAAMETVGIASILPFIAVLANPDVVNQNEYLQAIFRTLGFEEVRSFLVFLGLAFLSLFLLGLAMSALSFWAQAKFSNSRVYSITSRTFFGYMRNDYAWFLSQNSARLSSSILIEIDKAIMQGLFPALQLVASAMVVLLLSGLLFVIDPLLATSVVVVLLFSYLFIYVVVQRRATRVGAVTLNANRGRYRTTQEALGGIKVLKVMGLEAVFLRRFQEHSRRFASSKVTAQLLAQLPTYLMQGVVFGGMLVVILYLMTVHRQFDQVVPVLAMYAVAGYRLMPSLQNVYRNLVTLRNTAPVIDSLHEDLRTISEIEVATATLVEVDPLPLRSEIRLRHVHFRYPEADRDALQDLDHVIPRFSKVAFVGPTGCGKTTTVDIILGLLQPNAGTVEVDGRTITAENVRGWQRNIGYVPQDIYLADASVAANIAYGLPKHQIDLAAVERAARIARLHDFVVTELKHGYDTKVGERGVRLSGGQRQRIGIARALYSNPEVLVLDEATSALDSITEQAVMDAMRWLSKKKTIIMIAHRLTTVQACDTICLMDAGRIVAKGSYAELVASDQWFRELAGIAVEARD